MKKKKNKKKKKKEEQQLLLRVVRDIRFNTKKEKSFTTLKIIGMCPLVLLLNVGWKQCSACGKSYITTPFS
jgi:hypothetical protein